MENFTRFIKIFVNKNATTAAAFCTFCGTYKVHGSFPSFMEQPCTILHETNQMKVKLLPEHKNSRVLTRKDESLWRFPLQYQQWKLTRCFQGLLDKEYRNFKRAYISWDYLSNPSESCVTVLFAALIFTLSSLWNIEILDIQHTCVLKIFPAALEICSAFRNTQRKSKKKISSFSVSIASLEVAISDLCCS